MRMKSGGKKRWKVTAQILGGHHMNGCENDCNSISKCDIFDFMATYVGLTVIHPGGFNATGKLLDALNIDKNKKVVDIACGKGTTAIYIAEKYGCDVTAIDISEELIEEARYLSSKKGVSKQIKFIVGDAMNLPFEDNEFDVAVSQAMLVLVDDKIQTIKETNRVIKRGGLAGWLELSWKKETTKDFLDYVSNVLCSYCMTKADTYDGWNSIFEKAGITNLKTYKYSFNNGNMFDMIKDEGIMNTFRVFCKYLSNQDVRDRMQLIDNTFKKYADYFGYGIYVFQK